MTKQNNYRHLRIYKLVQFEYLEASDHRIVEQFCNAFPFDCIFSKRALKALQNTLYFKNEVGSPKCFFRPFKAF